jgi:transcription initiation factor TFIID TATA-box-binding protein
MILKHKNNLIEITRLEPVVRNIVATWNIGKKIDLNSLAGVLTKCVYEPEQFPGLIINVFQSCTFLIFSSGKIVITGAKSEEEIESSIKKIRIMIKNFLYN